MRGKKSLLLIGVGVFAIGICMAVVLVFGFGPGHKGGEGELQEEPAPAPTLEETIRINNNSHILAFAKNTTFVDAFITENPNYESQITILTPENITELSAKYPVIYGGLPNKAKALYKVEYKSNAEGKGILVIVDMEAEEVLKQFRTTGVAI